MVVTGILCGQLSGAPSTDSDTMYSDIEISCTSQDGAPHGAPVANRGPGKELKGRYIIVTVPTPITGSTVNTQMSICGISTEGFTTAGVSASQE